VQLNGTIGGQATTGHWTTSGSGTFQPNANTIDAMYCPSQSDLNAGQVTLTLTTNNPEGECDADSDQATLTLHSGNCGNPPPSNVCTVTQGFWGNEGGKKCYQGQKMGTLELLDALITSGDPLTVGTGSRSITFGEGSEECIIQLLPGGGSPSTLPSGIGTATINSGSCQTNPELPLKNGRINNVLLSQTITLALNVRLSSDLGDLDLSSSLNPGVEAALDDLGLGTTVADILELANRALAGEDIGGLSLSTVNGLVGQINEGYEGNCDSCGDNEDEDSSVRLLGNNPNPFATTGSTIISFSLQNPSQVNLVVYDISGRKVATLVDGTLPAGVQTARFDAASYPGLPSGIYMYRLNARVVGTGESHMKAEKMLLIR